MSSTLFDTVFETSLRIAILLDEIGMDVSADYIQIVDFMSLYGREFSVSEWSLNGDNPFMFCEVASRRELVRDSLRELVMKGCVLPIATEDGFLYRGTLEGHRLSESLDDEFSEEYRSAVNLVLEEIEDTDDQMLLDQLTRRAKKSVKGLL